MSLRCEQRCTWRFPKFTVSICVCVICSHTAQPSVVLLNSSLPGGRSELRGAAVTQRIHGHTHLLVWQMNHSFLQNIKRYCILIVFTQIIENADIWQTFFLQIISVVWYICLTRSNTKTFLNKGEGMANFHGRLQEVSCCQCSWSNQAGIRLMHMCVKPSRKCCHNNQTQIGQKGSVTDLISPQPVRWRILESFITAAQFPSLFRISRSFLCFKWSSITVCCVFVSLSGADHWHTVSSNRRLHPNMSCSAPHGRKIRGMLSLPQLPPQGHRARLAAPLMVNLHAFIST